MFEIKFRAKALDDLEGIFDYLREHSTYDLAVNFRNELIEKIARLSAFSEMGWIGRVNGTREFIAHKNYIFVYTVDKIKKLVIIKRVKHAAQMLP
jgi:toxin ParE1/3/4